MPYYTDLPETWREELEKRTGARILIEAVLDPDGEARIIPSKYDIVDISPITNVRDLDIEYTDRSVVQDVTLSFNDPDGYFSYKNPASPFHNMVGELYEYTKSGSNSIKLIDNTGVEFGHNQKLEINDNTNCEHVYVNSFTKASGSVYYHQLGIVGTLSNSYKGGTKIYTLPVEKKEILVRVYMVGATVPIHMFRGKIIALPESEAGKGFLTISSIKKFLLDEELRGAETGADKLKRINTNGDLVDTITWSEGSSGTLDRSKVIVKDNAKLRNWTCEFSSNTDFVLYSEDIGSGVAGKTEAEQIFSISGLDNYLYSPQRIIADKNYAYVISRSNALTIWDIRNKNNIQMVGVISGIGAPNYLNTPTDMVIKKNYAYITSADNALVIIDVSNPNNPTKVGHIVGAGSPNYLEWPESLYIEDNYAYIVTNYDEVLLIIDISDPTNPVQVGHTADGSSGLALCKKDNYVYTCGTKPSNYNDINVYDVSDPSSPILINTITHSKFCYKIKIHDGYLYALFLNDDIFNIYSLSDPTTPTLVSSLTGAGSPNYLDAPKYFYFYEQYAFISCVAEDTITIIDISDKSNPTFFCKYDVDYCNDIFVYGDYIYICRSLHFEYCIIKWSCSDSENSGKESIQIPFAAWGGTRAESDSVQFTTTINFDNQNVVQAIYNLYTKYIGMDNKLLGCSSFFEDKVIGTLNSAVQPTGPPDPVHPEDPTISIKISVPIVIGTNDVLTITEGNTTEDISVIEGNTVTSSFPPVITLPVSPLTNGFTRAATVTWKKKAAYDPAYNFDREYHYCDIMNYCVSLSFDKQMTRLQALEVLTQHLDGFLFSDSWGVEKLFVFRPKYRSSVPDVTKTVNLKKPNPVIETVNLVNEIRCFYGYDYTNSKYLYEYVYPENDTDNDSFLRNGFKRTKSFYLPGVFNESVAKNMTRHKYLIWKDGLSLIRFNLTLKGLVTEIGDAYNLISEMPDIDTLVEIVGIGGIKLLNGINIELVGLDVEKVLNNWFLLDDSGMGTARVLW